MQLVNIKLCSTEASPEEFGMEEADFPSPLPSSSLHHLPLEVGPLNPAKCMGSTVSSPAGSGMEPKEKSN